MSGHALLHDLRMPPGYVENFHIIGTIDWECLILEGWDGTTFFNYPIVIQKVNDSLSLLGRITALATKRSWHLQTEKHTFPSRTTLHASQSEALCHVAV